MSSGPCASSLLSPLAGDAAKGTRQRPIRVACIGGGQLGRMMAMEAPRLGIEMSFLDPKGSDSPAAQVVGPSRVVKGSLTDALKIQELLSQQETPPDVLTVEIEHVGVEALDKLERENGINIQPSSKVLGIIRDKFAQKVRNTQDEKGQKEKV